MTASVIVPTVPQQPTLNRALDSLAVASQGLDVDILVIEDGVGRGPSWARNRGLERVKGEVVFFCDADDTVRPDFFRKPLSALANSGADMCFFTYPGGPRISGYALKTNAEIRAAYLPSFFGYSFDDVARWNGGGSLDLMKEPGQVWRCAYRRDFLERHAIRFDESMTLFEDAAFLSACVARAGSSVSIPDELYDYNPHPGGNLASGLDSRRHWDYKFRALEFRKRLEAECGGVWKYCEASCVFTALELFRLGWKAGLGWKEVKSGIGRYLSDGRVREAIRRYPVSWRHPLVSAAVVFLCAGLLLREGFPQGRWRGAKERMNRK